MISTLIIGHRTEGGGSVFRDARHGDHARREAGGRWLGVSARAEVFTGYFLESAEQGRQPLTRARYPRRSVPCDTTPPPCHLHR